MTNLEEKNAYVEQPSKLLSKEKTELLDKYFKAMGCFYYIIPLKKVYDIINGSYEENYPEEAFLEFAETVPLSEQRYYDVIGEDPEDDSKTPIFERNLVDESVLIDYDVYDELIYFKKDINDYYILPKEELLKYADDFYEDKTPQYRALRSFATKYYEISAREAEERIFEFMFNIRDGVSSPLEAIKEVNRFGDARVYAEHYDEFEKLYIDLFNNTRNPRLNGYTPEEYLKITNDPENSMYSVKEDIRREELLSELKAVIELCECFESRAGEYTEMDSIQEEEKQQPIKTKKIGRNEPCPCGSGKKYKKCCGADL